MITQTRTPAQHSAYERFVRDEAAHLQRVLVAHYGPEVGVEVTADALAWAWENWDDLEPIGNRIGYLYRVAQSNARRHWRWRRALAFPPEAVPEHPDPEPGLGAALARLPRAHCVAVLLVHAHGWSYAEVAAVCGVPVSTVRNHVHRGLKKLRRNLGAVDG